LIQCHTDVMKDSNCDAVGAGLRVGAEVRVGGRLALFATGGRLVERERVPVALPLLDVRDVVDRDVVERDDVDREDVRDDDGVACERVPR
jgi:hypothetical protein